MKSARMTATPTKNPKAAPIQGIWESAEVLKNKIKFPLFQTFVLNFSNKTNVN